MGKVGGWGESTGFGRRLYVLRTAKGLTAKELADKAGCGFSTIEKMELEAQEPAWPLVLRLSRALDVRLEEFVPADGEEMPAKRPRGRPRKT